MSSGNWALVAPDFEAVDTLWKNPLPFVLWHVCGKPVLAYWLDEALQRGAESVHIYCKDRPHLVRAWIDKGDYWSKSIEVRSGGNPAPENVVHLMDVLPGMPPGGDVCDGRALLNRWFDLHCVALGIRESAAHVIDREISPGVWVGPGASIHPDSVLTAPCWVGGRARIGPNCRLGPDVYIGARAILEEDVEARAAVVCSDTFVGRHVCLDGKVAQGGILLNRELGVSVAIEESFIMSDLTARRTGPSAGERAAAAVLFLFTLLPAFVLQMGSRGSTRSVQLGGKAIALKTGSRGPLLLRRVGWLPQVVAGRMKLVGILPRDEGDWSRMPPELRQAVERSAPGVFSLADLHDCHDVSAPDEWMHAAYQAEGVRGIGHGQAFRTLLTIMFKTPLA